MTWLIFWLVLYSLLIIWLTIRHVRPSNLDNYLVNNRNTGTALLVFTTLATFVGGGTSIGLITMGYESGFAALGIGAAYVIGFFILAKYASRIHQAGVKKNIYSLPQYLNKTYLTGGGDGFKKYFSGMVTGVNIFIFFFLLAAQFVGMASLLKHVFEIGYLSAAVISCLLVITYTALSGLSGVIITDMIQFFFIVLMILFIFIPGVLTDTENLNTLRLLPPEMLNGTYYGIAFLIGLPLFISPSVLVRMDLWQRILAARTPAVARKMNLYSALGMLPFYVIFPLAGMAIRLKYGEGLISEDSVYLFLSRHCGEFALAFAVVGLLSALMSSGDSFLNVISISAVRDLTGWKHRGHNAEPSSSLQYRRIRMATLLFGILALGLALILPGIVNLMVVGIGTISIFVPIVFLALTHPQAGTYRRAAAASITAGFVVNVFFFAYGMVHPGMIEPKTSFIPAFLASAIALLAGMAFTRIKRKKKGNKVTA
mgnify:CR=1 FL=1